MRVRKGRPLVVGLLILIGLQFVGPARSNPSSAPDRALSAQVDVPPDVNAILARACRDCHSNETHWPAYAHVAPVSWLVIHDVNEGRAHMNLSEWNHTPEEGADLLDEVCTQVKKRAMPMRSYTWAHWNAPLSPAEVTRLCAWTNDAAERLMSAH